MTFDWHEFLARWSREWIESDQQAQNVRARVSPDVIASGWLGYEGATKEEIAAVEARLGVVLPPSYRAFLSVSDGWRNAGPFIYSLRPVAEIDWLRVRNQDLIDVWTAAHMHEGWEKRYFPTALQISDWGDSAICLLNPLVVRDDGECEASFFANWFPGAQVYGSFRELMEALHETFLRLRGPATS